MTSDHLDQRGFRGIGNNFGIDFIVPFKDSKNNGLTSGTTTSFTSNPAGTKVRFIEFDHPFEGGLVFTFLSQAFTQFQENSVNTSDTDMGQFGSVRSGKIEGKIAQN